jgi:DNA-binding protein H-NS
MSTEMARTINDTELEELIKLEETKLRSAAERLLAARTEKRNREQKRHDDALTEIMRLAQESGVDLRDLATRRNSSNRKKRTYKAGEQYQHPEDASKVWTVGSGRPPAWIDRAKKIA